VRFSQRVGKTAVRVDQQIDDIDQPLRNGLWDACHLAVFRPMQRVTALWTYTLLERVWHDFLKVPVDQLAVLAQDNVATIRTWFFSSQWFLIYDFIDFLLQNWPDQDCDRDGFVAVCNDVLERERSAYRILGNQLVRVTDQVELNEIHDVLYNTKGTAFANANEHLRAAATHLFDRKAHDYRNSMKESISAVEATAAVIAAAPGATLGTALKSLKQNRPLHPALTRAFTALYGYTSDAGGIRHALTTNEPSCDFVDAKFFFIACSAFINYLIARTAAPAD
jgi:hypothetical protein